MNFYLSSNLSFGFAASFLFLTSTASAHEEFLFRVPEHDPAIAHGRDSKTYSRTECKISPERKVLCEGFSQPPKELSNVTVLSMSDRMACAISGRQVVCWGGYGDKLIQTKLKKPEKIAVGDEFACAIDTGKVLCWTFASWYYDPQYRGELLNATELLPHSTEIAIVDNPSSSVSLICALNQDGLNCFRGGYSRATRDLFVSDVSNFGNEHLGVKLSKFFAEYDGSQKSFYAIDETSNRAFRLSESGYLTSACHPTVNNPCVPTSVVSTYDWDVSVIRTQTYQSFAYYVGNPHSKSNVIKLPTGASANLMTLDIVGAAYKSGTFFYSPPYLEDLSGLNYLGVELFKTSDWGTHFSVTSRLESDGTMDVSAQFLNPGNRNWVIKEEYQLRRKPKETAAGFVQE